MTERMLPWKGSEKRRHKRSEREKFGKNQDEIVITCKTKEQLGAKVVERPKNVEKKVLLHLPCETIDMCLSSRQHKSKK
jgi:hypothetical protein